MNRQHTTIATLLLAGSFVLAACDGNGKADAIGSAEQAPTNLPTVEVGGTDTIVQDVAESTVEAPAAVETPRLEYAEVIMSKAVTEKRNRHATVIAADPVYETSTTTVPREVCEDVVVQERMPERDGNVGGTAAGAAIGALVGNQIGSGSGRKAATVAGAVAGGMIGNRVDRNHEGGKVVERIETQCQTVQEASESSRVTGYRVTYRNADGSTGNKHMDSRPGERIVLGSDNVTIGYDVTYRYDGQDRTVRMERQPTERLPVIDGQVVLQTADASSRD